MTGIVTEKHTCINYETGAKTFVVVARSGSREDWIVVPEKIWRRAFIEGWYAPFEDCQIEYGPDVKIKLKMVLRTMAYQ